MKLLKSTFIFFYFMGLLPIGLISFGNIDPLKLIIIAFYVIALFKVLFTSRHALPAIFTGPSRVIFLLLVVIALAYFHMVLTTDRLSSIFLWFAGGYVFFWIIASEITSYESLLTLLKRLGWMVLATTALLVLFYFVPSILSGPLLDARMGSFRGYLQGHPRIFTPGMIYITLAVVYAFCRVAFFREPAKTKLLLGTLAIIIFIVIALVSSVRTNIVGILLSAAVILVYRFNLRKTLLISALVAAIVGMVIILPGTYNSYIKERLVGVAGVAQFDYRGAISGNISYGKKEYETYYWRVTEAAMVIKLIDTWDKQMFGAMGLWYGYGPDYQAVQPHIGYAGLYYCSGLVGLLAFAFFIIYFSLKAVRMLRLYRGHQYEYLAVFVALVWFIMLLTAASNAVFYLEDNIILVSAAALSIVMTKLVADSSKPEKMSST